MCHKSLHEMVRSNPCPGTTSSYLHIAAALGHESIANILVNRGFGGFADSDGKSAAAIAVEAGQLSIFQSLLEGIQFRNDCYQNSMERTPIHLMFDFAGQVIGENILSRAAHKNDLHALSLIMHRCVCSQKYLSHAVFDACKAGSLDFARKLVHLGANPYHWYLENPDKSLHLSTQSSSLWRAAELGRPDVLASLMDVAASLAWASPPFDVTDMIAFLEKTGDRLKIEPFVRVLASHFASGMRTQSSAEFSVTVPTTLKTLFPPNVVRLIMSYLDDGSSRTARPYLMYLSDLWVLEDPDKHLEISNNLYLTPWLERFATSTYPPSQIRCCSKYLRILLDSLSNPQLKFDLSLSRSPYIWYCLRPSRYSYPNISTFLASTTDDVLVRILRKCLLNPAYLFTDEALQNIINRRTSRATQALADVYIGGNWFFLGSIHDERRSGDFTLSRVLEKLMFRQAESFAAFLKRAHTSTERVKAWADEMHLDAGSNRLCLMRCCVRAKDWDHAVSLYQEMKRCNSDGDFALNYPAGYVRQAKEQRTFQPFDAGEWIISKRITLAIYAWNYRLRRQLNVHFRKPTPGILDQ